MPSFFCRLSRIVFRFPDCQSHTKKRAVVKYMKIISTYRIMRYQLPAIITHNPSEKDSRVRSLALFMSVLMLVALLLGSFHHHDDLDDHPDCSICAVTHHQVADSTIPLPYTIPTPIISRVIFIFTVVLIASSAPHTYSGRAPPL